VRAGVIQRILSRLLWFAVVALLVPAVIDLVYDRLVWAAFALPAAIAAIGAVGLGRMSAARAAPHDMQRREGLFAVTAGWLIVVLFTAGAYELTGVFPGFAGAVFESMSGYTTTGATIFADIEALPHAVLFARSFSHWIGGMGIIVLSVAILPELAVGGMQLMAAEASGIDSDKLAPRIAATARRLWGVYVAITAVTTGLLLVAGMGGFDAVNHAMSTIATGGFSTKNASIAAFDSVAIELIIIGFMYLAGLNFALLYRVLFQRQPGRLWRSAEVRLYTAILALAIVIVTANLRLGGAIATLPEALRQASFQVLAIMTTTGFVTADFDAWPHLSRMLLVSLMLVGGCAGSTAGGSKVVRLYVVAKHALIQLRRLVRPRLVATLQIGGREISRETTEAVLGFYLLFIASIGVLGMAMTALGMDLVSGTTAAISALNSIGPGLGTVGAVQNFGHIPDTGLYLLSAGMLLGRLELYTVIVLFTVHFWRRG
jgi:trk system potassium uptake protein